MRPDSSVIRAGDPRDPSDPRSFQVQVLGFVGKFCEKNRTIWQCVKTNSTPVVHIKIAGLKW